MKVKVLVFMSLLLASFGASAAGGWTGWQKVHIIYTQNNGNLFIQLKDSQTSHVNPDACNNAGWYVMNSENAGLDSSLKLLLTSKSANLNARIYLNGCTGSYPTAHHIQIY